MYLKRLYQHNKFLFLLCIFFVFAQLFINYKRGVVCTPFYHYGMYSEVITPKNSYSIPEIFVDHQLLSAKDFTPQMWDNITQPIVLFYQSQIENNLIWQQDIHRLLPFTDSAKFANTLNEAGFKLWYGQHLEHLLNRQIDSVQIAFTNYFFNGSFKKAGH